MIMSKKVLPAVFLPLSLAAAIPLPSGCGDDGGGTTATTTPEDPPSHQRLVCNDAANTVLCWNETTCVGTPSGFCAAHIDGDVLKGHKYPNAQFDGTCITPLDYPQAKCGCDYGVPPTQEDLCDYDDEPTSGEPTSGEPPEEGPLEWVCTVHSQAKCVEYNYTVDPIQTNYKDCWVDPNQPDDVQPCVIAEDLDGAKAACKAKCDKVLVNINAEMAVYNANNDPGLRNRRPADRLHPR
jgi:hypothetical protein